MPSVWSSGAGCNIGIVSFKNMYADKENGTTVTLITTQGGTHGGATDMPIHQQLLVLVLLVQLFLMHLQQQLLVF